jgi:hypothetical protein
MIFLLATSNRLAAALPYCMTIIFRYILSIFIIPDEDGNYLIQDPSIPGVNTSHPQTGSSFQVTRMTTSQDQSSRALVNKNRSQQIQSIAPNLSSKRRVPQRIGN